MSNQKFIQVQTVTEGPVSIAIGNIASVKSYLGGTVITLKEIKNGNNVEVHTSANYGNVINLINQVTNS